ncbi:DNA-directed RNA polymerase I and III [Patellaria atrata CBS 101060]|uniref:DNA-directed RNA polymerases I and III subunit RPAC2 n=1 Tax=Patellaria atrata CBS 101060 TaxID=1346257 RepID=A0A9P4SFW3_9PEZI|nr:DNA-directed RNA polymerase I and III [Patellaria atrata CBS 101060]
MPSQMTDRDMPDAPPQEQEHEATNPATGDNEEDQEPSRIRVLDGAQPDAASFQFDKEDHTLGNALRYVIVKNPVVEFCGYTIPHHSEEKMNLRIQTYDGADVYEVLEKGLDDLMDLCDVVTEKFTISRNNFNSQRN